MFNRHEFETGNLVQPMMLQKSCLGSLIGALKVPPLCNHFNIDIFGSSINIVIGCSSSVVISNIFSIVIGNTISLLISSNIDIVIASTASVVIGRIITS